MLTSPYSIYVNKRPLRVAFLIEDKPESLAIIDTILAYNRAPSVCRDPRADASGVAREEARVLDVEGGHATELAAVLRVVEWPRAMHRGAVVPNHEVADAPGMAVDELRLGCVLYQVTEKEPRLGNRPVDDPRRM